MRTYSLLRYACLTFCIAISLLTYADSIGKPFQVNNYAPGNQSPWTTVTNSSGQTIVLFNDATRHASFMQRFDQVGRRLQSDDFYVLTAQSVAIDDAGDFVIARVGPDGTGNSVFLTVFNNAGSILVPEFRANNTIAGQKGNPHLAMSRSGEIAVTWTQIPASGPYSVYVRRFHLNGTPLGNEFMASDPAVGNNASMGIACDSVGNFVATWLAFPTIGVGWNIYARRFNSNMTPQGVPFLVNSYTPDNQAGNAIAMNDSGSFVIVWESRGQETPGSLDFGIYGRRFATMNSVGTEFHVNSQTAGAQRLATVGMAADGSFTVAWQSQPDNSNSSQVYAREFDPNGVPRASEFLVSTGSNSVSSGQPYISMDPTGNALIIWWQYDGTQNDVYAQRYLPAGVPVQALTDGVVINNLAGATGSWQYFKITVPAGKSSMDIVMTGPDTGDADLYIRYGALPTLTIWDARPFFLGNNEGVRVFNPPPGDYLIGINAASGYSSVSLQAATAQ
jgi:serine protease